MWWHVLIGHELFVQIGSEGARYGCECGKRWFKERKINGKAI